MSERVVQHLEGMTDEIIERLRAYVACASVSADPAFAAGMASAREFLMNRLAKVGLENLQLLDGGGHPAIYGDWLHAPGKPTLLVYGHYDVQPPDPLDQWQTPPFELTRKGDRLYGRGASDNKGSSTIAIESLAAFLAVEGEFPLNLKVLFEGEEEIGAPSLPKIFDQSGDLLKADLVLSADGGRMGFWPALNVGCRGIIKLELTLETSARDLHSGRYGGTTHNSLQDMARLLASLHDNEGRILVEGMLDPSILPTSAQRAEVAELGLDEDAFFATFDGVAHGDPAYTAHERLVLLPTVEINGMWGGYTGPGSKTIIPSAAHAKITARLVSGQDPDAIAQAIKRHLEAACPKGARLVVKTYGGGAPAYTLPEDNPLLIAADRILRRETGKAPVRVRHGGTLPVTSIFREKLGADTLMFGFGLPADGVHAPNESYAIESIREGLRCWPMLISEIGAIVAEEKPAAGTSPRAAAGA
ncbi:MAG: family dipeptidase [Microvirga sp.]|jgi:acetylornithine deacetylase/succinyl-diaminopimelate desuccinylase-like protein|nr:family dipeptidase [Microvirga sp.]